MAARSGGRRKVCYASSFDAGAHAILQNKSSGKAAVPKRPNNDASRSGQASAGAKEAGPVRICLMMLGLVAMAYVPIKLGTTNERCISTLGRRGQSNGTRHFPFPSIVRLTVNQHQQATGISVLSIAFPTWLLCCRSVTQDGTHGSS